MLDAHPDIHSPIPLNLGRDFWYGIYRYGDLSRDDHWLNLTRDVAARLEQFPAAVGPPIPAETLFDAVPQRTFAALYAYVYARGLAATGKSRLVLKENYVGQHLGLYTEAFPGARFVYQVRDPRDYLLSCRRVARIDPMYRSDAGCLQIWKEDQAAALNALYSLGPGRVVIQRYEDLVRDPERVLAHLCGFLEVPFDAQLLRYHERRQSREAADARPVFWRNLSRPVMADNVAKYRHGMSRLAVGMVEHHVGALMLQLGYRPAARKSGRLRRTAIRLYEAQRRVRAVAHRLRGAPKRPRASPGMRTASSGRNGPRAGPRVRYPYSREAAETNR
jgi:hypothetical protein